MSVFRCYTEKKAGFDIEAMSTKHELRGFLGISGIESVRILNRYDVEGIPAAVYESAKSTVFSEPQTDSFFTETPPAFGNNTRTLIVEALPGQYDQRADACASCLELLGNTGGRFSCLVRTAKLYVFEGDISDSDYKKIHSFLINPVESREALSEKPETLTNIHPEPKPTKIIHGFTKATGDKLEEYLKEYSLVMDIGDLQLLLSYFRDTEKRDPTITELRVLDTYWSDHCRHTTFFTHLTDIIIDDPLVKAAYESYLAARQELYGEAASGRPKTLMDVATIAAKVLRSRGLLENIEESEEVNACSIHINAEVDGNTEDWLLMFKNETHNHPTEVEPFGGAATCVGGAIRDPLSGRAYVYQAMRITGAGDPRAPIEATIPGKLPQRKLTRTAAQGYSSYGNQIGLPSGFVHEIYHSGYIAKRMELGALVGAVKAENIIRERPAPGDKVLLLGCRTGRDGIGGATSSSKTQTNESVVLMSSEVQKGNAPEERKIQRLFLDPEVTKIIKKCNDFGAGGVSVAVGELADGLDVDLSLVRTKYGGLDGTEIAVSESQERMAVVLSPCDVDAFIKKAEGEGLEAYVIAEITESPRMVMRFDGQVIVDLSREFLSTNGATKTASVHVPALKGNSQFTIHNSQLKSLVSDLRFCSQRGLHEMFDGTVGASGILMKNGGKTQSTPVQSMASLLPVAFDAETSTCSVMAYGFDPYLSSENPFEGAKTAVITSVAKLVAAGCDPDTAYLTFQEYFERLSSDPKRWGKPFSALLGAFEAQMGLELAAIGGKDSMSGSFNEMDVPPTLVSFAVAPNDAKYVITPEFKEPGHGVVVFEASKNLGKTKEMWKTVRSLIEDGTIVSAWAVTEGGIPEAIFKMSLGNEIGFDFTLDSGDETFFGLYPGSIIAESCKDIPGATVIGRTTAEQTIKQGGEAISISELKAAWEHVLEDIFPTKTDFAGIKADTPTIEYDSRVNNSPLNALLCPRTSTSESFAKPRALILAFPGTSGELDAARAIKRAGGVPRILVVRNLTTGMLNESISVAAEAIAESQILVLPSGSSLGDEPDGPAKYIDLFLRVPSITEAVLKQLKIRDALMLGISNGFQALLRTGLVPFGEIIPPDAERPTLSKNLVGRHQARYVFTRISSVNSPWMSLSNVGDVHAVAISHGDGRFFASDDMIGQLAVNGLIATQYTDADGRSFMHTHINPNGSRFAVEGLFSPDGRVFGKMGLSERSGEFVGKNIYGNKHQPIFESGINYFL